MFQSIHLSINPSIHQSIHLFSISSKNNQKKTVEKGSALAAKDTNGKSDPYLVVELVVAENKNGKWTNIKTSQKVTSSIIEKCLDPVWNFQAYLMYRISLPSRPP